jgi:predicted kinase
MTTLYMMIGLPASGKGHFANIIANEEFAFIVESDAIRKELYGDECIQGKPEDVFKVAQDRILGYLRDNLDVVFDATNISYKWRMVFLQQVPKDVRKVAVMVYCPVGECFDNMLQRGREVPTEVITRMWKNFDVPFYGEGWDEVRYINNSRNPIYRPEPEGIWFAMEGFQQDNPNHAHTVGIHCDEVVKNLSVIDETYEAAVLTISAKWHDMGKIWTKTFRNMKGETTEIAHYYNHENVGAYEIVGMLLNANGIDNPHSFITDVSSVIRFHMRPYMMFTEKSKDKFRRLVGDRVFNWVIKLNTADREGKGDSE